MKGWSNSAAIPVSNETFQILIKNLVFECPSCTRKGKSTKKKNFEAKGKKELQYYPVSARNMSFKRRGITGGFLITILAEIRRPLCRNNAYMVIKSSDAISVTETVESILENTKNGDDMFELMVYQERTDMPDTEAIYYYIRNSFAHGSFEVITQSGQVVYLLESSKEGKKKALMRLKEKTLIYYTQLEKMSIDEIIALRKK